MREFRKGLRSFAVGRGGVLHLMHRGLRERRRCGAAVRVSFGKAFARLSSRFPRVSRTLVLKVSGALWERCAGWKLRSLWVLDALDAGSP